MFKKYIPILLLTLSTTINAQTTNLPLGSWRSHAAFRFTKTLAVLPTKVIAGADQGLFSINKSDETSNTYLRNWDSFSENEVSNMLYNKLSDRLIITYTNGNIDVVKDGVVSNISDFYRSTLLGAKKINHILFENADKAILSTDLGILVLNLAKNEISETYYNIGLNGKENKAKSCAIVSDSLFVIGNQGLLASSLSPKINKIDFKNWKLIDTSGIKTTNILQIASLNNSLYLTASGTQAGIYKRVNGNWIKLDYNITSKMTLKSLKSIQGNLYTCVDNQVLKINNETVTSIYKIKDPAYDFDLDENGNYWIASYGTGLVKGNAKDTIFKSITPSGFPFNTVFRLSFTDDFIACTSGGYNKVTGSYVGILGGFGLFNGSQWHEFSHAKGNFPFNQSTYNLVYSPLKKELWVSTFNGPILISSDTYKSFKDSVLNGAKGNQFTNKYYQYTRDNSPIVDFTGAFGSFNYALDVDSKGGTWVSISIGKEQFQPTHYYINPSKTIPERASFQINTIGFNQGDILCDNFDNKWSIILPLSGGGLLVFREKSGSIEKRIINSDAGSGKLPGKTVYSVANARNGDIWIGTENGIAVWKEPSKIWTYTGSLPDASLPVYDSRALMQYRQVNCIYADAADRKWVGTTDGVWLFNADGSEQIHYFNSTNSPLLSNNVTDIAIDEKTGEVFFATDKGIVSYRALATGIVEQKQTNLHVFPNPVKSNFGGAIGIMGLPLDATVKITDIAGNLVWERKALGTSIEWDMKDYTGKKVLAGVYLVLGATVAGEESILGKIAVLE